MRTLLLTILLAGLALGQVSPEQADTMQFYFATYQISLSGSGTVFTLQSPANASKRVYLQSAILECSVDCTVTLDKDGSAATGTAITAVPLNSNGTPVATFYRSSNVGSGTALLPITVKAGTQSPLELTYSVFSRGVATAQNYNWRVSSITGTARVTVVWGER